MVALKVAGELHSFLYYVCNNKRTLMHVLKLTQIGNSVGVILPKEALSRLKLTKGETVFLTETPDSYALTPYDPAL